ncbi:phosphatidate cytidylyltransferase [Candidatus Dependentiae bacterium]|nr:phosphatidate cytidylyltransferase [Candidatus Dependentiae bacterium]
MTNWLQHFVLRAITGTLFGFVFWVIFLYAPPICFSLLLALITIVVLVFEWRNFFAPSSWQFWLIAPWYPILPFSLLIYLNHIEQYRILLFFLFAIAFAYDTGAYLVGSLIGEHKIMPHISPGKSWEGLVGGYTIACCATIIALTEQCLALHLLFILLFTAAVCTALLIGDLFESLLKRNARIKDSGDLLPGHGGFLDRFDGILFAGFLFFLARNVLLAWLQG